MIDSLKIKKSVYGNIQQNAETAWINDVAVIEAINSAMDYLFSYTKWHWSLVTEKIDNSNSSEFTLEHNVVVAYRVFLDETECEITNLDKMDWESESNKVFIKENVLKFYKTGDIAYIQYNRGPRYLNQLDTNVELDIPHKFFQAIIAITLWFLYMGGLEQGANIANMYYNMSEAYLRPLEKSNGYMIGAKGVYTN